MITGVENVLDHVRLVIYYKVRIVYHNVVLGGYYIMEIVLKPAPLAHMELNLMMVKEI